jgi:signal transduction histidine kinase
LRTPLTAIRSAGEIALQKSRTPDEYRETLESILEDVHRMVYIVEQLLMLSRLDADHVQAGFSRLNFCETIHNVVMRFEPLWKDKQIDMQLELENPLWVQGENALLEEALANLLDNAIRFTPVQGTIRVQASSSDTRVNMAICDSGPGISVDYRTQVFERFARIPGNESPGAGLGLAIVADIVSIHNGDIHVADNKPRGACFRITLNR